jgi:hypothetical protein
VHEYDARWPILHIDVYRLNSYQEVIDLGFEELLDPGAILVVEWGEAVAPLLPRRYLEIDMRRPPEGDSDDLREIRFRPRGIDWTRKLESMRTTAETLLDAVSPGLSTASRFVDAEGTWARDHMKPEDSGE